MAQQTINLGSAPDAGDGDPLRTAGSKINANDTELYAHKNDTSTNPHNVTAAQVNAEPANANIQAHISTTSGNPHSVTAAQTGAEPANANIQTHIAITSGNPHGTDAGDVGAEPANANIQAHIADTTTNPHNVDANDVGADPAGSAATVQGNLDTHEAASNPHSITPELIGAATIPGVVVKTGAFTVNEADGFDVWYKVTGASVTVTIPAGLTVGHRFSINCKATTTFSSAGVTIEEPTGKQFAPFGDNSSIGFVVNSTNTLDVFGDLAEE
jgi:hypothetical protein